MVGRSFFFLPRYVPVCTKERLFSRMCKRMINLFKIKNKKLFLSPSVIKYAFVSLKVEERASHQSVAQQKAGSSVAW